MQRLLVGQKLFTGAISESVVDVAPPNHVWFDFVAWDTREKIGAVSPPSCLSCIPLTSPLPARQQTPLHQRPPRPIPRRDAPTPPIKRPSPLWLPTILYREL